MASDSLADDVFAGLGTGAGAVTPSAVAKVFRELQQATGIDFTKLIGGVRLLRPEEDAGKADHHGKSLSASTREGSFNTGSRIVKLNAALIKGLPHLRDVLAHELGHSADLALGEGGRLSSMTGGDAAGIGEDYASQLRAQDKAQKLTIRGASARYRYSKEEGFANAFREAALGRQAHPALQGVMAELARRTRGEQGPGEGAGKNDWWMNGAPELARGGAGGGAPPAPPPAPSPAPDDGAERTSSPMSPEDAARALQREESRMAVEGRNSSRRPDQEQPEQAPEPPIVHAEPQGPTPGLEPVAQAAPEMAAPRPDNSVEQRTRESVGAGVAPEPAAAAAAPEPSPDLPPGPAPASSGDDMQKGLSSPGGKVACPNCQATLTIPPGMGGQLMKCPKCDGTFTVPPDGPPEQEQAPEAEAPSPLAAALGQLNAPAWSADQDKGAAPGFDTRSPEQMAAQQEKQGPELAVGPDEKKPRPSGNAGWQELPEALPATAAERRAERQAEAMRGLGKGPTGRIDDMGADWFGDDAAEKRRKERRRAEAESQRPDRQGGDWQTDEQDRRRKKRDEQEQLDSLDWRKVGKSGESGGGRSAPGPGSGPPGAGKGPGGGLEGLAGADGVGKMVGMLGKGAGGIAEMGASMAGLGAAAGPVGMVVGKVAETFKGIGSTLTAIASADFAGAFKGIQETLSSFGMVGQMAAGALGTTQQIMQGLTAAAGKANPVVVERLTLAFDDAVASIGDSVIPVVEYWTKAARVFGDAIATMMPDPGTFKALASANAAILEAVKPALATVLPLFKQFATEGILGLATAVKSAAVVVKAGIEGLERLGIINPAARLDSSVGKASRPASFSSSDEYARKIYQNAFSAGAGGQQREPVVEILETAQQIAEGIADLTEWASDMYDLVKPYFEAARQAGNAGREAASGVQDFGLNPLGIFAAVARANRRALEG